MAASVASTGAALAGLALIAPPLSMRPLPARPPAVDGPVLIVAGSADSYCPPKALARLEADWPAAAVTVIDGADHFFFGRLAALEAALAAWASKLSR
jgi:pimeloyl-ACP methyl ester carboxylesterase